MEKLNHQPITQKGNNGATSTDFIEDTLVDKMSVGFISKQDEIILAALNKHLPGVDMYNIASYADRLSIVIEEGTRYPQFYWLDRETDKAVHFLTILEPEFKMEGNTATATQSYFIHDTGL